MMFGHRKLVGLLLLTTVFLIFVIPSTSFTVKKEFINRTKSAAVQLQSVARRSIKDFLDLKAEGSSANTTSLSSSSASSLSIIYVQMTAIHIDKSEFPLSKLLFKLTLKLALDSVEKRLEAKRIKLLLSIRSANTCSRQYAGAVAAEEYYLKKARLFIVSGCDDAIRGVSRLASGWQVPVMTAAGFGADLNDKSIYKSLVRVAFSLKAAVEFLVKILKSFQWKRVNLIVDDSDTNSLALKESIEKHFAFFKEQNDSQFSLNTISLDLHTLTQQQQHYQTYSNSSVFGLKVNHDHHQTSSSQDRWPNNVTETAIREALRQSSLFSRVNILLIPQHYLRKFMLSVYDQGMANGLYTFINIPLLLMITNSEDQLDSSGATSNADYSKQSYTASTGENVFIWRSLQSTRNSHAKQAFESLMSIYLRTPTTKAYIYFLDKLFSLANTDYATTTTQASVIDRGSAKQGLLTNQSAASSGKIQLSINPYSAAFYDCLQIYARVLEEAVGLILGEANKVTRKRLASQLHSTISSSMRARRWSGFTGACTYFMIDKKSLDQY